MCEVPNESDQEDVDRQSKRGHGACDFNESRHRDEGDDPQRNSVKRRDTVVLLDRDATNEHCGEREQRQNDVDADVVFALIEDLNEKTNKASHQQHDHGWSDDLQDDFRDGTLLVIHRSTRGLGDGLPGNQHFGNQRW